MASRRLWSRPPFPNNSEVKSVLSASLQTPAPPFRAPQGELWALGLLRARGGEGWGGYREFRECGAWSWHTGGLELQTEKGLGGVHMSPADPRCF